MKRSRAKLRDRENAARQAAIDRQKREKQAKIDRENADKQAEIDRENREKQAELARKEAEERRYKRLLVSATGSRLRLMTRTNQPMSQACHGKK